MRASLFCLILCAGTAYAQDASNAAAQANQLAIQASQQAMQASQQALDDAQRANQQAMQSMQDAQNAASQSNGCGLISSTRQPKLSVKAGKYTSAVTVRIKDATRHAVIYYTKDGWTPTMKSHRYRGPITISATTTLQAMAIAPCWARSSIVTAVYTFPAGSSVKKTGPSAFVASETGKVVLPKGMAIPLSFADAVTSKTAQVGDTISLVLDEDLKLGNTIIAPKGSLASAIVTEVDGHGMNGVAGDLTFEANSLTLNGQAVPLTGSWTKEGKSREGAANGTGFIPFASLAIHGGQAEIEKGAALTAKVASDTTLAL